MSKEVIEVPEEVARAYQEASPEQRTRAERAMAVSLMSRQEAARTFQRITERASTYAAEQGLTPETLNQLLRDDE